MRASSLRRRGVGRWEKIPFPRDDDDGSTVLVEVKSNDERFCETVLTILTNLLKHWITDARCCAAYQIQSMVPRDLPAAPQVL